MVSTQVVGILGGMGPAAGAEFVQLFVAACSRHLRNAQIDVCDQAYPEHWLAQVPVPDRSAALALPGSGGHQPLEAMLQAVGRLAALGATSVAVACNTAHAWHAPLQSRFPQLEVLHVARELASALAAEGIRRVGLLATEGTLRARLYDQVLEGAGVECVVPDVQGRERLMQGIYQGVKAGNLPLARQCFSEVAHRLAAVHGVDTLVMACTEIPLGLGVKEPVWGAAGLAAQGAGPCSIGLDGLKFVDPAVYLARALASRAYARHLPH